MKNTFLFIAFITVIVALFAFAFSFSQSEELDGQQIFLDNKCTKCHSVESLGIVSDKDEANDLSDTGTGKDAELLKKYLLKEQPINEKEHKIKFKGTEAELDALVNWLLALSAKTVETEG